MPIRRWGQQKPRNAEDSSKPPEQGKKPGTRHSLTALRRDPPANTLGLNFSIHNWENKFLFSHYPLGDTSLRTALANRIQSSNIRLLVVSCRKPFCFFLCLILKLSALERWLVFLLFCFACAQNIMRQRQTIARVLTLWRVLRAHNTSAGDHKALSPQHLFHLLMDRTEIKGRGTAPGPQSVSVFAAQNSGKSSRIFLSQNHGSSFGYLLVSCFQVSISQAMEHPWEQASYFSPLLLAKHSHRYMPSNEMIVSPGISSFQPIPRERI